VGTTSKLQSVSCHVGSHSVTCHPSDQTQVNAPRLNPSQPDRHSIYLPPKICEAELTLMLGYIPSALTCPKKHSSSIQRTGIPHWTSKEIVLVTPHSDMYTAVHLPSEGFTRSPLPSVQWAKSADACEPAGRPARHSPHVRKHLREICVIFARYFLSPMAVIFDHRQTDRSTDGQDPWCGLLARRTQRKKWER